MIDKSQLVFINVTGQRSIILHAVRGQRARERSPSCSELEREREKSRAGTYTSCEDAFAGLPLAPAPGASLVFGRLLGDGHGVVVGTLTHPHTHSPTPTHTTRFSGLAELSFEQSEGHGRYPKRDYSTLSRVSAVRARSSHSLSLFLSLSLSPSLSRPGILPRRLNL